MNALLPERKAQYPQTKMLADIYADLFRVYNLEVFAGRFDDVPYQVLKTLKDKNFLRTLELSGKLLTYLGDTDRYYRQWLGLFLLLARDHVENFSFTDACQLISEQWNYKLYGKFLNDLFNYDKDLAVDVILANHLPNLVKLTLNRGEKTQ
jgi:hypothetical protein